MEQEITKDVQEKLDKIDWKTLEQKYGISRKTVEHETLRSRSWIPQVLPRQGRTQVIPSWRTIRVSVRRG